MPSHRLRTLFALAVALGIATGCTGGGATFSPSGPCLADGRAPGAFPELERLLPASPATPPTTRDSGRSCSDSALGTLVTHGVHELRSAGETWDRGNGNGTTMAVLALPTRDLPVGWAEEFYEVGARTARKTDRIETSRPTIDGSPVFRLDTLNDLSLQSVLVWADAPIVRVVLVATPVSLSTSRKQHDDAVEAALVLARSAGRGGSPGASWSPESAAPSWLPSSSTRPAS
jgi:hypothetical protein